MPYGLTATGFVIKPLDVILAEVEAAQKAATVPNLNVSATSVVGGAINGPIGHQLAELWELGQALYAAMDPDAAEDAAQDNLYSLTNSLRHDATFSKVTATVNLTSGTTLLAGVHIASVAGNPEARFTPESDFTAPSTGNHSVVFVAIESGPVVANSGTLTVRDVQPGSGWNSVTNALDAKLGTPIETNAQYRIRRALELAAQGGGTLEGIRGDLLQVDDVDSVSMLENTSAITDANGLPPHSFEAIVVDGDGDDIGESIWSNKPAGIASAGTELVEVEDSEGRTQEVRFARANARNVYVGITVTTNDDYAGDAAVEAALVNATQNPVEAGFLEPGDDVFAARLVCAALEVEGVVDVHVGLSFSSVPSTGTGLTRLVIGELEIGVLDTSRITVFDGGGE